MRNCKAVARFPGSHSTGWTGFAGMTVLLRQLKFFIYYIS